ncbi:hypothetical protein GTY65_23995 [Streptomyces sp. SID8379]|uniref:hypothetical protein n=1 Tax=unclassified Streptomyces TaxID=2593676 RepID=UPI0003686EE4|nr:MULTISPECIES: hypothetical protein [unclassified Streptomyces]MYW67107.1 hypothetical protein [Streptomyces sp. SID8379]
MSPRASATDRTLMQLPLNQWVTVQAAAQSARIDHQAILGIVRAGRRRGVLRTRLTGSEQQVMRIYPAPRRPARAT